MGGTIFSGLIHFLFFRENPKSKKIQTPKRGFLLKKKAGKIFLKNSKGPGR